MIENILSIIIMLVLVVWVITDIMLDRAEKRAYVICAFLVITVVFAEMYCSIHDNTLPDNRIKSLIGNMLGFGLSPFIFVLEASLYDKKHTKIKFIPAVVNFLFSLLSLYTGWIFYVDKDCTYSRGPLYALFILVFSFSVFLSLVAKMKTFRFLPGFFKLRTVLSCGIMFAGLLFQVVFPQYHSTWIIICVFFILDYAIMCEINSMVDGLTGLLNKTVFNKQMNMIQITEKSNRYLLMMDVNNFKKVNDDKGHLYGDMCLREIASVIKGVFKKHASVFRFGGDEFCVLLSAESKNIIDQDIQTLMYAFSRRKAEVDDFPDIAVGYAKFQVGIPPREIIDSADFNMYSCKKEMKENSINKCGINDE